MVTPRVQASSSAPLLTHPFSTPETEGFSAVVGELRDASAVAGYRAAAEERRQTKGIERGNFLSEPLLFFTSGIGG
jgi:hypothetical protein